MAHMEIAADETQFLGDDGLGRDTWRGTPKSGSPTGPFRRPQILPYGDRIGRKIEVGDVIVAYVPRFRKEVSNESTRPLVHV